MTPNIAKKWRKREPERDMRRGEREDERDVRRK
jgi:hypothetical protein